MISQDYCATIDWFPPEVEEQMMATDTLIHNWSMTLVFEEVVPFLREQGVMDDAVFDTIFVRNPARWLGR
jgi:phosphotriesterase-related protein